MKLSNGILQGVMGVAAALLLSGVVQAKPSNTLIDTKAFNASTSVLPLGARVVAGDLSKNEFFILGKAETRDVQPVKVLVTRHSRVIATKGDARRIREAAKRIHVIASQKNFSKIKLVLNKPTHQLRGKKNTLQLKTALNKKNKHHIAIQSKRSKVAVASN